MAARKVLLTILDGWGIGPNPKVDAIAQANTPVFDDLMKKYPNSTLVTFGEAVGLPEGQMGNSEVGHMNIGAGRIVYQELARINKAIKNGELANNPILIHAFEFAIKYKRTVHFMGLLSDGGVHSHIDHLLALCNIAKSIGIEHVYVHAFMDGRDTDPKSGVGYLQHFIDGVDSNGCRIASVIGRYYAMDRDKRWERIKLAYNLIVNGIGEKCIDPIKKVKERYEKGETDEFLQPIVCTDEKGEPLAKLKEGDLLICFNFRTDRPREISLVLTQKDMPEFGMHKLDVDYITMTRYDDTFQNIKVLFEKENLNNTLGEVLARKGLKQTRIAETEKYPHVTFFFSGGREEPFENEKRILIPSPKVATYDLKPEMSAVEVTEAIVKEINDFQPDFICLNYANTDMVGHTGVFEAAVKAAETVDNCLGKLLKVAMANAYDSIIIADHGNADYMVNDDGTPNTAHTMNPVPFIYVSQQPKSLHAKNGKLADIAPTILYLMEEDIPIEMTGQILIN